MKLQMKMPNIQNSLSFIDFSLIFSAHNEKVNKKMEKWESEKKLCSICGFTIRAEVKTARLRNAADVCKRFARLALHNVSSCDFRQSFVANEAKTTTAAFITFGIAIITRWRLLLPFC